MSSTTDTLTIAAESSTVRRPNPAATRAAVWGPPLLVLAGVIGIWYLITYVILDESRRFLMPPPHAIFTEALFVPQTLDDIWKGLVQSAAVALVGLLIAIAIGITWAIAMSQARWIERSTFPYAVVLQCIPILALVPLIGFWFGFDFFSRVVVCVMISLFPMVSNTLFGLQSVDRAQRELFQLQKANRWVVLTKLELPAALPAIFAGTRIAAGLSVVGAIVGDFFFRRGTPGIGSLISNYQSRVQGAELFASILVASLFGVVIFWFFGWLAKRVVGKWYDTAGK